MAESTEDSSQIVREQSESVAATNLKVLGDGPAFYTNQAYAQSNDSAAGWRTLNQAAVSASVQSIQTTSPQEGASGTAMAAILAKMMVNTPPAK